MPFGAAEEGAVRTQIEALRTQAAATTIALRSLRRADNPGVNPAQVRQAATTQVAQSDVDPAVQALPGEIGTAENDLAALDAAYKKLDADAIEAKTQYQEALSRRDFLQKREEAATGDIASKRKELDGLDKALAERKTKADENETSWKSASAKLDALSKSLETANRNVQICEVFRLVRDRRAKEAAMDPLEQQVRSIELMIKIHTRMNSYDSDADSHLRNSREKAKAAAKALQTAESALSDAGQKVSDAQEKLASARSKEREERETAKQGEARVVKEAEDKIAALKTENAGYSAEAEILRSRAFSDVQRAILVASQREEEEARQYFAAQQFQQMIGLVPKGQDATRADLEARRSMCMRSALQARMQAQEILARADMEAAPLMAAAKIRDTQAATLERQIAEQERQLRDVKERAAHTRAQIEEAAANRVHAAEQEVERRTTERDRHNQAAMDRRRELKKANGALVQAYRRAHKSLKRSSATRVTARTRKLQEKTTELAQKSSDLAAAKAAHTAAKKLAESAVKKFESGGTEDQVIQPCAMSADPDRFCREANNDAKTLPDEIVEQKRKLNKLKIEKERTASLLADMTKEIGPAKEKVNKSIAQMEVEQQERTEELARIGVSDLHAALTSATVAAEAKQAERSGAAQRLARLKDLKTRYDRAKQDATAAAKLPVIRRRDGPNYHAAPAKIVGYNDGHIFVGDTSHTAQGIEYVSGFHSEHHTPAKVTVANRTPADALGCYKADITMTGVPVGKLASSMFPPEWDVEDVQCAVDCAYHGQVATFPTGDAAGAQTQYGSCWVDVGGGYTRLNLGAKCKADGNLNSVYPT